MSNSVNNNGISVNAQVGNLLNVGVKIGGSARNTETQSNKAIQNLNQNVNQNPNRARRIDHAEDAGGKKPESINLKTDDQGKGGNEPKTKGGNGQTARDVPRQNNGQTASDLKGNRNREVDRGEDGSHVNYRRERASDRASDGGLQNGRGRLKGSDNGQNQKGANNGRDQKAANNGRVQIPVKNGQDQTAPKNGQNQRDTNNGQIQTAPKNDQNQTAQKDGQVQVPTKNGQNQTAQKESRVQTPIKNSQVQVLLKNGQTQTPIRNGQVQTPIKNEQYRTEGKSERQQTPVRNGENRTAGKNEQNQTPIRNGQNRTEVNYPQNQTNTTLRNNGGDREVHPENHENHSTEHEDHPNNRPTFETPRNTNAGTKTNQNLGEKFSIEINLKANGNQPKNLVRNVVNQVLQQNDVYLKNNAVNKLVTAQTIQTTEQNKSQSQTLPATAQIKGQSQTLLPREVSNLVQNISKCVIDSLNNPQNLSGKMIQHISAEISHQLQEQVQTAKNVILKSADFEAVPFKQLNIGEKMHAAVELMPPHLPEKALEHLQNCKTQDIVNGMLITRGLIVPNEKLTDTQNNLAALKSNVLPNDVSMKNLRDVGQLVKVLIADSTAAKSTANLDLAVQKFVRILLANNELGVLLATISLASQTSDHGGLVSRSIALAQIYELISSLQSAGEKAMKNAAQTNNKIEPKILDTAIKSTADEKNKSITNEKNEIKNHSDKQKTNNTESALRQFLEFNPALAANKSASSFHNPDDARQAQKDFVNLYHQDIDAWLRSGNHRFVKDVNFDKPVGVVVERNRDGFFSANTARIVLVRDGSVQGWHFLKSFLVK